MARSVTTNPCVNRVSSRSAAQMHQKGREMARMISLRGCRGLERSVQSDIDCLPERCLCVCWFLMSPLLGWSAVYLQSIRDAVSQAQFFRILCSGSQRLIMKVSRVPIIGVQKNRMSRVPSPLLIRGKPVIQAPSIPCKACSAHEKI